MIAPSGGFSPAGSSGGSGVSDHWLYLIRVATCGRYNRDWGLTCEDWGLGTGDSAGTLLPLLMPPRGEGLPGRVPSPLFPVPAVTSCLSGVTSSRIQKERPWVPMT